MNKIDSLKEERMRREPDYLSFDLIEGIAQLVIDPILRWANLEVFSKMGGALTVAYPTGDQPNARISTSGNPAEPRMEIMLPLLIDIYRDALAFPLVTSKFQKNGSVTAALHEDKEFRGARFLFDEAIPEIDDHLIAKPLRRVCQQMAEQSEAQSGGRLTKNDVYCRLLMTELMLVWTFFHELAHSLQQHAIIRTKTGELISNPDYIEELESVDPVAPNLHAQAREVLADVEGIHLTLLYLQRSDRLTSRMMYVLHCAVSCMYQRFYNRWTEDMTIANGKHPHPHIRDEFATTAIRIWMTPYLVKRKNINPEEAGLAMVYLGLRASLFTSLFRNYRIEEYDRTRLPSFLELATRRHSEPKRHYIVTLLEHIRPQAAMIRELHLYGHGGIDVMDAVAEHLADG